nr:Chain D, Heat Shock Protein Hsp 90-alpha [Homo sapiens]4AIF_E Chain E, Heat Shock Protein Hsp 90-alpha [Homo sapiens]4CGQ_Q Chain Q, Heat Shock Protein Hsp 90-alpha [Homo sapiens]4CGU_C Chain C, Heat Shock Protein Hsp 90-alpha [Homo sapiens]4CGV_E Chain E, Heat Shock Protein Hsp 90-alpha [Homo sapiens]4CGV_F Chain F, Heat Shock Protein Hsp 90-alpha [Homo sapiens]4CGW_C Chain C, Heat Shock Protein Hsp 90-alpha [Homo sapiens]4CGW_D Chain D, Heat Shock Protein Hsp 90-alpha [Homo sapiens]
SRMEEVD